MGRPDLSDRNSEAPHKTQQVGWLRRGVRRVFGEKNNAREALSPAPTVEQHIQALEGGDLGEVTDDQAKRLAQLLLRRDAVNERQRRATVYRESPYQIEHPSPSLEQAEQLFGKDFLGPTQFKQAFGFEPQNIPAIPFSQARLEQAKKARMMLILHVDKTPNGAPMTMKQMREMQAESRRNNQVLFNASEYKNESFFAEEAPRLGWRLVSKDVIPHSTSKNEVEQLKLIVKTLKDQIFAGTEMPHEYKVAIIEFESQKDEIARLIKNKRQWRQASEKIENLKLNQLTRATPAEMVQMIEAHHQNTGHYLFEDFHVRTPRRTSHGFLASIGGVDVRGVTVGTDRPGSCFGNVGVSLSLQS